MFSRSIDFNLPKKCHLGLEIIAWSDVSNPVQDLDISSTRFLLLKSKRTIITTEIELKT